MLRGEHVAVSTLAMVEVENVEDEQESATASAILLAKTMKVLMLCIVYGIGAQTELRSREGYSV